MFRTAVIVRDCHAEVIRIKGAKPEQSILRASHPSSGCASAVNVKYFQPEHKLAMVFGRPFFIVVGQGLAGTGISTKYETWFDLTLSRTDPVFAFTREGDETIWPSPLEHEVLAAASPLKRAGNEEIKLDLAVRFQREARNSAGAAYYVRRGSGEITLDPALSPVPDKSELLRLLH